MDEMRTHSRFARLDKVCAVLAGLLPIGIALGGAGFESVIGLVALLWIVRCLAARENPFPALRRHPLVLPWAAWFGCILLSLLINGPGDKGLGHDVAFLRYPLFLTALLDISRRIPLHRYLLYGLGAGVLWAAINTSCAYLFGVDLIGNPLIRYTGKLKEAARISGLSVYAAPFLLVWGAADTGLGPKRRLLVLALGLLSLAQVLQTHVRTVILSVPVALLFCLVYFNRRRISRYHGMWALLGVVLAAGVFFKTREFWDLSSIYDRVYYWKVSFRLWLENPIAGVGVSAFQGAYKAMAEAGTVGAFLAPDGRVFSLEHVTHAHNLFLMLLASTGILGLFAFLWLFLNAVRMVFQDARGVRAGLVVWPVVLFMMGLTGFNIYHAWYQALLAFWLALIAGLARREKQGSERDG